MWQANWKVKKSIFDLWGYLYLNAFTLATKSCKLYFTYVQVITKHIAHIIFSFFNTKHYKHFKSMRTAILCLREKRRKYKLSHFKIIQKVDRIWRIVYLKSNSYNQQHTWKCKMMGGCNQKRENTCCKPWYVVMLPNFSN